MSVAAAGVELKGVTKGFGAVPAVRGVDLVVPTGDIGVVVGPSGCGKTTTLRLVAGFEMPDQGEIRVGGELVAGAGTFVPPERRRVGMLFQHLALFPHLDVAGNIGYGLRALGKPDRRARVAELLELVGLAGYERRFPHELSGGQAQRVAVARALAPRPAVVLFDEPFSSLEVGLRAELRAEVRRILKSESATALLVTHDQDEALALGDQVAVMLAGVVMQVGKPDVVYRDPATPEVAAFVGDANLLRGEVRGGWIHTELGRFAVEARDGHGLALVRPEDVDLDGGGGVPARVVDVEYHGHDQLVSVVLESGSRVRVRLHSRWACTVGDTVSVRTRVEGVVVFSLPQ